MAKGGRWLAVLGVCCILVALLGGPLKVASVVDLPAVKAGWKQIGVSAVGLTFIALALAGPWTVRRRASSNVRDDAAFVLPLPPEHFAGRRTEFKMACRALRRDRVCILVGPPGVGKSALAAQLAEKRRRLYSLTVWISGSDRATRWEAWTVLSKLSGSAVVSSNCAAVTLRILAGVRPVLLVIDGVNANSEDLTPFLPAPRCHLIVTTQQRSGWEPHSRAIVPISPWDFGTAAKYLLDRTGDTDTEAAVSLARRVDGLPQALDQLIGTATALRLTLAELLAALGDDGILSRPALGRTVRRLGITETYQVAVRTALRQLNEDSNLVAATILSNVAFFDETVPMSLLEMAVSPTSPDSKPLLLRGILATLADASLIDFRHDLVRIHELVRAALRSSMSIDDRSASFSRAADSVWRWITNTPGRSRWEGLPAAAVAHVDSLLTHLPTTTVVPITLSAAVIEVAEQFVAAGNYNEAVKYAKRAVDLRRGGCGSDAIVTVEAEQVLAQVLTDLNDFVGALELDRHVVKVLNEQAGVDTLQIAWAKHELAIDLRDVGEKSGVDASRVLLEEAYETFIAAPAASPRRVAWIQQDLADALLGHGDNNERAISLLEQALQMVDSQLGEEDPDRARPRRNLAKALRKLGRDIERATLLDKEAVVISVGALGRRHPLTARSFAALGCDYRAAGARWRSRHYLKMAVRLGKQVLPDDHNELVAWQKEWEEVIILRRLLRYLMGHPKNR